VDDPAVVLTASVPVAALALVTLMLNAEQVTPGGNVGQVIATIPVKPPAGVTVIVDMAGLPAVAAAAAPDTVKLGVPAFIVKFTEFDVPPPPGFVTVTPMVPAVAICAAVMAAVTCVAFTNVVTGVLVPKLTVAPDAKLVPVTVNVNAAPPAVADVGESEMIVGTAAVPVTVTVVAGEAAEAA